MWVIDVGIPFTDETLREVYDWSAELERDFECESAGGVALAWFRSVVVVCHYQEAVEVQKTFQQQIQDAGYGPDSYCEVYQERRLP